MEYGIKNKIKYTTLQIRSIIVTGNKQKNDENGTDANPPQGGWGMGSKEPIQK